MATVKNNVLGEMSGSVGNVVTYLRYGEQIYANKPRKYKHKSPHVIAHRRKYSYVNRFAGIVYHNEVLGDVWRKASDHNMAAYNEIIKLNSRYFKDNHPTLNNVITPGGEINPISEILYDSGKLQVKLLQNSPGKLTVIIVPFDSEAGHSEYLSINTEEIQSTHFEIMLLKDAIAKINDYPGYIIFAAIVNKVDDKLSWTKTFACEGRVSQE